MTVTNPNDFFVLHIEDEPQYVEHLKKDALQALGRYGVEEKHVSWLLKGSATEAKEALVHAEEVRPGRGFDALIVDLRIPLSAGGSYADWRNGLDVLSCAADLEWPTSTICISAFAHDPEVLKARAASDGRIRVDDWLGKNLELRDRSLTVAKMERCLIPTEKYVHYFRQQEKPFIIESPRMKAILRELIFLARRPYIRWPLCRLLLLGSAGSGKGALSRVFYSLLPAVSNGTRAPFVTLNCATAVSEGHGGRIALFGVEGFGGGVRDRKGVFETATDYENTDGEPDPMRAGLVFLDEFAELAPDLQASILTALEEGRIAREGSGRTVPIACHVVFATNFSQASLVGTAREITTGKVRVRSDLIDRIPHVFDVPPLRERREEVRAIVEGLVTARLYDYDSGTKQTGKLSASAVQVLDRALRADIINSVRQLESIADILGGEWCITESNMAPILRKARIFDKEPLLTSSLGDYISPEEQARMLTLPTDLQRNDLPHITQEVVQRFFDAFRPGGKSFSLSTINFRSIEERVRAALLTLLVPQEILFQIVQQKPDAIRRFRKRTLDACNLELPSNAEEKAQRVVELLLDTTEIGGDT